MRLLITRPEPDAARTAAELRARGHEVLLAPMLQVELLSDAELGTAPWAAVLITSANGSRAIASHARRGELLGLPVLAVGQASAAAAVAAGFTGVTSADGDGADLAKLAAARFSGAGKPLLYLAGEERARDLAGELAGHGIAVHTVVVYRTVRSAAFPEAVQGAFADGAIDGVLHFSRRSVESYVDCARGHPGALDPLHYCLSKRAAEPLTAAGAARIRIAPRPDEGALLELVTSSP